MINLLRVELQQCEQEEGRTYASVGPGGSGKRAEVIFLGVAFIDTCRRRMQRKFFFHV